MHRIIRIIVYANSPKEARENAETILDEDLVETKVYDYGTFFDDDSSSMSGKARWGNHIPSVVLADSKKGKKLINEGMKYTKESFFENIGRIKEAIKEYSVEELFEGEVVDIKKKILEELNEDKKNKMDLNFFRYFCFNVSKYQGGDISLYDNNGEGIRNNRDLKWALDKYGVEDDLKVYVVPVDVHF